MRTRQPVDNLDPDQQISDEDLRDLLAIQLRIIERGLVPPQMMGTFQRMLSATTELAVVRDWKQYIVEHIKADTQINDAAAELVRMAVKQRWICPACDLGHLRTAIATAIVRAVDVAKTGQ